MSNDNSIDRFLELDAGRALGDLTPDEVAEWKRLAEEFGGSAVGEIRFDDLVSALETAMGSEEDMPASVKAKLQKSSIPTGAAGTAGRRRWVSHPAIGWAVAACFAVALLLQNLSTTPGSNLVGSVERESDVIRLQFARLDSRYGNISGEVLWSDRLQKGFMKLNGVTPNNPDDRQFQLWIFDPDRDENPVDGGVFNIADGSEVIIPIDAKLKVSAPDAFAITVEQPGGVVVSKRETLLALAK